MITTVKIGTKDMYADYGCILAYENRGNPSPKTHFIEVPLRDGRIDATNALSDQVYFDDREMKLEFVCLTQDKSARITDISNYLDGRRMEIIFSDDASFKYIGRINVSKWETDKHSGRITLEIIADPYKYDINSSMVDWEWDVFDFEEGIINETGELIVDGQREVSLICRRKRMFPTFIASADMQVKFNNEMYELPMGEHKLYELFFVEGENILTFYGNGTISIDYIGGDL